MHPSATRGNSLRCGTGGLWPDAAGGRAHPGQPAHPGASQGPRRGALPGGGCCKCPIQSCPSTDIAQQLIALILSFGWALKHHAWGPCAAQQQLCRLCCASGKQLRKA
jgi:hypothetical protein